MNGFVAEFIAVNKKYPSEKWGVGAKAALEDFSFNLTYKRTIGLLGANGAGKTTAIKLLLGLIRPESGTVSLFGMDPGESKAKANVGYLPERPYFPERLSGYEFLRFHRDLYGGYLRDSAPTDRQLLAQVGLEHAGHIQLQNYSKGMLQRIGIAQAILNNPDLLILDEPMSGLDPIGRYEIKQIIQRLSNEGKTVLFSTHILSDAEELCDEIVFLEKGKVKVRGPLTEIFQQAAFWEITCNLPEGTTLLRQGALTGKYLEAIYSKEIGWRIRIEKKDATLRFFLEAIWQNGAIVSNIQSLHKSLEQQLFGSKGSEGRNG